ncbi:hypothetical protein [Mesorhizobium caraganae]|uniref:hypothetical protein n=1 Tax=Mesorhizobium caraganae TaxID=483206 RepID=UPI0017848606|nr:hypothetical protein [Mesorhizobium caraganae]
MNRGVSEAMVEAALRAFYVPGHEGYHDMRAAIEAALATTKVAGIRDGVCEALRIAEAFAASVHKNGALPGDENARQLQAIASALLAAEPGAAEGWETIETAPFACHVLATRFDEDCGEWVIAVVLSPPSAPFTHWRMLPAAPHQPGESGNG